jgi:hypothetical protein
MPNQYGLCSTMTSLLQHATETLTLFQCCTNFNCWSAQSANMFCIVQPAQLSSILAALAQLRQQHLAWRKLNALLPEEQLEQFNWHVAYLAV